MRDGWYEIRDPRCEIRDKESWNGKNGTESMEHEGWKMDCGKPAGCDPSLQGPRLERWGTRLSIGKSGRNYKEWCGENECGTERLENGE
jgi:hypothetical protein